MSNFIRQFGDLAVDGLNSARVLQDVNSSSETPTGFDHVVLWSVNAIWISLVVLVAVWICRCNGSERITSWTSNHASRSSDQQYRSGILRRQEAAADASKLTPEKQRKLLRQTWKRNQVIMVVEETDLVSATTNEIDRENGPMEGSDDGTTHLTLRLPNAERRVVPNCCAVCLCSYEVDESVVWSNDCRHCFHLDCVSDWLIKMQDGLPCPFCRQKFVELEENRKKDPQISWAAGPTMDISVIRL